MMRTRALALSFLVLALVATGVAAQEETGVASYYGDEFVGKKTASGEIYEPTLLTAAHRSLRFGIRLQVTNLDNGRTTVVRVNDRGPFVKGRIIDLSFAAAEELGMINTGTAQVAIRPLKAGESAELPPQPQVYVQMGAYRTQFNAQNQARSLRDLGLTPHIRQEGSLFRVYLAAGEGSEADALLATLARAEVRGYLQLAKEPAGTDVPVANN